MGQDDFLREFELYSTNNALPTRLVLVNDLECIENELETIRSQLDEARSEISKLTLPPFDPLAAYTTLFVSDVADNGSPAVLAAWKIISPHAHRLVNLLSSNMLQLKDSLWSDVPVINARKLTIVTKSCLERVRNSPDSLEVQSIYLGATLSEIEILNSYIHTFEPKSRPTDIGMRFFTECLNTLRDGPSITETYQKPDLIIVFLVALRFAWRATFTKTHQSSWPSTILSVIPISSSSASADMKDETASLCIRDLSAQIQSQRVSSSSKPRVIGLMRMVSDEAEASRIASGHDWAVYELDPGEKTCVLWACGRTVDLSQFQVSLRYLIEGMGWAANDDGCGLQGWDWVVRNPFRLSLPMATGENTPPAESSFASSTGALAVQLIRVLLTTTGSLRGKQGRIPIPVTPHLLQNYRLCHLQMVLAHWQIVDAIKTDIQKNGLGPLLAG
ncbi:hypothetical protein BCR39DRAFT_553240 [Naematelia encephala]|uniref:Uncharacterized protein n=1 Tax=Naematelia encephala TaxID=71784 RepID=A0A1Y2AHH8_9TREE|nr:hypothetical protein BCR39DRAFT_553240 [Naematelia encephala]